MSGRGSAGWGTRGWGGRAAGILLALVAVHLGALGAGVLLAACGDGVVEAGEACDQGAQNGTFGSCCSSSCQLEPASVTCRNPAGLCDIAEVCTGASDVCPADGFASMGTTCRPAIGECDFEEVCSGADAACPGDMYQADGSVCTDDGSFCTGPETCSMGACVSGPIPSCDDMNSCTEDYCYFLLDTCAHTPIPDAEQAGGPDQICGTTDDNLPLYGMDQSCGTGDDAVGDGVCVDNCFQAWNPGQENSDADLLGDACDATPCRVRQVYAVGNNGVWSIEPVSGSFEQFSDFFTTAKDVAIDPGETFAMVTNYGNGTIRVVPLGMGSYSTIPGLSGPWGIDVAPNGTPWVAERDAGRISRLAGATPVVHVTGLSDPTGLDVNEAGTQIYVTEYGTGQLSRVSTTPGSSAVLIASGLNAPVAIELGAGETDAYVLEGTTGALVRVDLSTGTIVTVAGGLVNPLGLTLSADKTKAYVTDQLLFGAIRVVQLSNGGFSQIGIVPDALSSGVQLGPKPPAVLSVPDNASAPSGTTFSMPLTMTDTTGLGVFSADVTVGWNPTVLTATAVNPGSLTGMCTVSSNLLNPGQATISVFCTSALSGAGSIASIDFQVAGAAGKGTPVQITSAMLNEGSPAVCADDGSFFAPVQISGEIVYYRDDVTATEPGTRPVDGAQVSLSEELFPGFFSPLPGTSTGCAGSFQLPGLAPVKSYRIQPAKSGDMLGAVDPFDAALNAQRVVGLTVLTANQTLAADASGNGALSSFDSSLIARLSVGLIAQLPVAVANGSDFAFVPVPQAEPNQSITQPVPSMGMPGRVQYAPILESAENQDFLAILYGDVSGNWQPVCPPALTGGTGTESVMRTPGSPEATTVSGATAAEGRLILPDTIARPGDTITIPVRAEGVPDALAFYLDVRYDPAVLTLTGAQGGAAAPGFSLTPNTGEAGRARLALFGTAPLGGDGDIVLLTFRVAGKAGSRSRLELSAWTVNEGRLAVSVTQGSVRVDGRRSQGRN